MNRHSSQALAARLQAIADPVRLRLLQLTEGGEMTASACIAALGLSQPRVARHLKILVDAGFLISRRDGRFVIYAQAEDQVTTGMIQAVLVALEDSGRPSAPRVSARVGRLAGPPVLGARTNDATPTAAESRLSGETADSTAEEPQSSMLEDFLL